MDMVDQDSDFKRSSFNEASYQMRRIDFLKHNINLRRPNPFTFDPEANCYNYEIVISCLVSLHHEVLGKLEAKEKEDLGKIRDLLLKFNQMQEILYTPKSNSNRKVIRINDENWETMSKMLLIYEENIKAAHEAHGLEAPLVIDEGMF